MQWIRENAVVIGLVGGFAAFFMTTLATKTDVTTMISQLATKADVAALPTRADLSELAEPLATKADVAALPTRADLSGLAETVNTQRETVAALGSTVTALSQAVDRVNETVNTLSATVAALSQTVGSTDVAVERLNETAETFNGAVNDLMSCMVNLHRYPDGSPIDPTSPDAELLGGIPFECQAR